MNSPYRELAKHLLQSGVSGLPESWFSLPTDEESIPNELRVSDSSVAAVTDDRLLMSWSELEATAKVCSLCRLCETRNSVVFGDGLIDRPMIAFVGEGPGAEEDKQGLPFVGRAGELLTAAITKGLGLTRQQVYITNTVKCRPPENRVPLPDEAAACFPYLQRQLELLQPRVIVTLGGPAQRALLGLEMGITKLRGTWHQWRNIPVMPTLHPAYLLRNPAAKRDFWNDLQKVMKELGLERTTERKAPAEHE